MSENLNKAPAQAEQDPSIINAHPTKELFISMLVRDLTLRDAIGDLVDNSIDGARSLGLDTFNSLKIAITANENEFIIEDNCGGIPIEIARNYAFKFGRDKDTPTSNNSIGQFGIGMKRALFKIGKQFKITSVSKNSKFNLEVDVNTWQNEQNWEFKFSSFEEDLPDIPLTDRGTKIVVSSLNNDTKIQFGTENFIKSLVDEIEIENLYNLFKGMKIIINGFLLVAKKLEIYSSDDIKPALWRHTFEDQTKVEIICGISEPSLEDGGWYIFCNGRLVVAHEQTEVTGWTGSKNNGAPKYHGQYNRFRGFVFFEAENASNLPWNTTKTSMDMDSPTYKFVRARMIEMMRPIISFLNKVKEEREAGSLPQERVLEMKMNNAPKLLLNDVKGDGNKTAESFQSPEIEIRQAKRKSEYRIAYSMPKHKVEKVKKHLNASSLSEIGSRTFDYFYDNEIED